MYSNVEMTFAPGFLLKAFINVLQQIMIFIFSVVKDERTKIENLADTGKTRLKPDSAIIRRCP